MEKFLLNLEQFLHRLAICETAQNQHQMETNPSKKKRSKWLALISMPVQMGAVIFAFSYFGNFLDNKYSNPNNLFVKGLTLLGVALAFYNLNRQLKEINKFDQE